MSSRHPSKNGLHRGGVVGNQNTVSRSVTPEILEAAEDDDDGGGKEKAGGEQLVGPQARDPQEILQHLGDEVELLLVPGITHGREHTAPHFAFSPWFAQFRPRLSMVWRAKSGTLFL